MIFMDKKMALKNLIDLDNIFRENKSIAWLQDGTLLGYFRENNFISHDLDTDMGMMFKDFSLKILEDVKKLGFEYNLLGYPESCLQITFKRFEIRTDLFFYYEDKEFIYHSAFLQTNRIDYRYNKFNLKEIEFIGQKFIVPSDELKFIITKYGEDWEKPDLNWNYAYSPKNHYKSEMILDWKEQNDKIKKWLKGDKVKTKKVITYGTFDTFHYGHIEILKKAKSLGDHLTVSISTDEFNNIKGKESVFTYQKRCEWVKSISYVDEIIPEKDWSQKKSDIENNNIDILVMGDDWLGKFDDVNCKVIYFKRTNYISSTEIKKIIS
jgi:glycerol-3-phosphate cytidylyltransferase